MIGLNSSVTSSVVDSKYSASFDGTDDYIDSNNTFKTTFNDSFSISVWVKVDDGEPSATKYICGSSNSSSEDEVFIKITTAGLLSFTTKSNNDTGTQVTDAAVFVNNANDWKHIICTATKGGSGNTAFVIYVNGSAVASTNSSTLTVANHGNFDTDININIGALNNNGTRQGHFDGAIDEFAIFNVALDADAAAAIYNGGSPLNLTFDQGNYDNSSALQAYYRMGNGLFDDKEQGSIHDQDNPGFGSNLVVNADFSDNSAPDSGNTQPRLNGGIQFNNWTEQQSSGLRKYELTSDGEGTRCTIETPSDQTWHNRIYQNVSSSLTVGDLYEYEIDVLCSKAVDFRVAIQENNSSNSNTTQNVAVAANQRTIFKEVFKCIHSSNQVIHLFPHDSSFNEAAAFYEIRNPRLRKLNGKPALTSGGVTFSSDTP